jgi:hypothetical protein
VVQCDAPHPLAHHGEPLVGERRRPHGGLGPEQQGVQVRVVGRRQARADPPEPLPQPGGEVGGRSVAGDVAELLGIASPRRHHVGLEHGPEGGLDGGPVEVPLEPGLLVAPVGHGQEPPYLGTADQVP